MYHFSINSKHQTIKSQTYKRFFNRDERRQEEEEEESEFDK